MKLILSILIIISLKVSGRHYFVIPTMNNPEAKAASISKKFYQLSRPVQEGNTTEYLFGWIKHPQNDSVAIVIDSTFQLPKGTLTATHIANWINETYQTLTTTQRNTLTNYINKNNTLRISRLIITARIKLWTKAQMEARGWFNYPGL